MIGRFTLLFAAALVSCESDRPAAQREPDKTAGKVEIVKYTPGQDAIASVAREAARAKSDGKRLVVYVGAAWCEPCVRFHDAAAAGKLDGEFPDLRLLELDRDRDEEELREAGCLSKMIPLFALPTADGRCSDRRMEGSIKGEGAVAEITPRLRALLK